MTEDISLQIRCIMRERGETVTSLTGEMDRVRSYISIRVNGLKPWTVDELDILASCLGYKDFWAFMRDIKRRISKYDEERDRKDSDSIISAYSRDHLSLAASHDDNKELEREEDYS